MALRVHLAAFCALWVPLQAFIVAAVLKSMDVYGGDTALRCRQAASVCFGAARLCFRRAKLARQAARSVQRAAPVRPALLSMLCVLSMLCCALRPRASGANILYVCPSGSTDGACAQPLSPDEMRALQPDSDCRHWTWWVGLVGGCSMWVWGPGALRTSCQCHR